jgi:stage II sporulation protein D
MMKISMKYLIRTGIALALMVIIWSCSTVPGLKEETTGSFIKIPFVRVLLVENYSEHNITGEKSFAIECLTGGNQSIYYSSHPVKIALVGSQINVFNHKGNLIHGNLDEVNIIPRGNNNRLIANKSKYRGMMKFLPNGMNLEMINIVYMEDYLKGVVPPEIGKRIEEEIEAVKAQAIAARTYAMAHLQQYQGKPYDMKSSIIDQVYEGFSVEDKLINQAIELTSGEVLFYNDEYVNAFYHSTCGGMTDDVNSVWDRKEVPYLKAVKDDDACSWSKYFKWTEIFTEQQLRGRIEQYMSSDRGRDLRIGQIKDIEILSTTPGGRIHELVVVTEYDRFKFKKDRIRWVIGRTSNPDLILPSDRFQIELKKDKKGIVEKIIFKGNGYGHGVGMCQCGAIGLSRQGWTYNNILTHYYTGVELKKLY